MTSEASGTGKSQVYHYFSDKTELVEAVVRAQIERVLGEQAPFLDDLRTMRGFERWRDAIVVGVRGWRGAHGCPMGSLASEQSRITLRGSIIHPGPPSYMTFSGLIVCLLLKPSVLSGLNAR